MTEESPNPYRPLGDPGEPQWSMPLVVPGLAVVAGFFTFYAAVNGFVGLKTLSLEVVTFSLVLLCLGLPFPSIVFAARLFRRRLLTGQWRKRVDADDGE